MLATELLGASVRVGAVGRPPDAPLVDERGSAKLARVVARADAAQVELDGIARYDVLSGREVVIEPVDGADQFLVEAGLHAQVTALLLGQQGRFGLHATTVRIGGASVALMGSRRAGKSTTALELRRRGHDLVADDVSPVDLLPAPVVVPYGRAIHIDPEAAERLGLDLTGARLLPDGKHAVPTSASGPVELAAVVALDAHEGPGDELHVRRLAGAEAFGVLHGNVNRDWIVTTLWPEPLFRWATALAAAVEVHAVSRPRGSWTVDAVADAIEAIAAAGPAPSAP